MQGSLIHEGDLKFALIWFCISRTMPPSFCWLLWKAGKTVRMRKESFSTWDQENWWENLWIFINLLAEKKKSVIKTFFKWSVSKLKCWQRMVAQCIRIVLIHKKYFKKIKHAWFQSLRLHYFYPFQALSCNCFLTKLSYSGRLSSSAVCQGLANEACTVREAVLTEMCV